jgi:4-amino-4-deoxy-L-arabinose transferase-like glycosyltransferase
MESAASRPATPSAVPVPVPVPGRPPAARSARADGRDGSRPSTRFGLWARADLLIAGGLFLFAAILRLGYILWAPVFIGGDSLQYYQPVYDFLNGHGFTLSLKRPPAYPALVLAMQTLFGTSFIPIVVVHHLLGAATVALTYGLGRLTFGRAAGVLAGVLVAISGQMMRWEHFLMSEALFTFCYILAVFLLVLGLRRPGPWPWVWAGLAIGLAILARSAGQALLLVVPPALLLVERAWRPAVAKTAIVLAACALVILPWMIRNQVVHGAFTTAGAAGQNLVTYTAILHRPEFSFEDPLVVALDADPKTATARQIIQKAMEDKLAKPQLDVTGLGIHNRIMEETRMSQAQADAVMRQIALRAIASRPTVYLRNTLEDFGEIFRSREEDLRYHWDLWSSRGWRGPFARFVGPATPEQEASFGRLAALDGLYHPARAWLPLAALFLVGVAIALLVPAHRPALLLALAAVTVILVSAGTVGVVPRYRLPADPLINVVAMGGLVSATAHLRRRRRPSR